MNSARDNILQRLRTTSPDPCRLAEREHINRFGWTQEQRIERFRRNMEAVRAEVLLCTENNWIEHLEQICKQYEFNNLLISEKTRFGEQILENRTLMPRLISYDRDIEHWQNELFYDVDAGFTTTLGAIAETGTLILWPDRDQPRLMSLVPPVHIAIVEKDRLFTTFAEAIVEQQWVETGMPTNALLISGPSKSADIEQTLAYGVHGPKDLIVIVV